MISALCRRRKPADWANELHPYPAGFRNLAGKFVDALRVAFPGRI
jgi:hypothetical protein